ncbi:MAG TPA: 3-phosphoshikimate 1-carboxyvinyltransferase [Planctomycetaceae bacterium]|nr:3-phosphoshikimate 1-carboxyvinyltransferase [Planctomycetaceae bacterium]HIQ22411.1 3-phosphoshikimate 1-carboxyvinyltransferase [Planctomycetota bacterium]
MIDRMEIEPARRPICGTVRPPGSKSITNRALVCGALASGQSRLVGALDSEDTRVMIDSLSRLGIRVSHDPQRRIVQVAGCGGRIPVDRADLYVANSGTTVRFLTALVCLGHGTYRLDGTPRMRQRPIEDLLDALRQLGADARSEAATGCPPVLVHATGLRGGKASVSGKISSQFLSGVLLAAPCALTPVELEVTGRLVSRPYVKMTLEVMAAFGVEVQREDLRRFLVPAQGGYRARQYEIEPDASAASYFFAAAAITGGTVTVEGLGRNSLQGDVRFCHCLARMGCHVAYHPRSITVRGGPLKGITVDMNAISDTVQTLAAVALFAQGPTTITGVGHIRHKETDRIAALATELRKLGAAVEERPDGLRIVPGKLRPAEIETYQDHRMAMSFALVGLVQPGVVIHDPGCTAKTYPQFFEDISALVG